jgi:hypothetical protein
MNLSRDHNSKNIEFRLKKENRQIESSLVYDVS